MIDRSDEYSRKNYYRAEAVAMRRIIAERGYTLAIGWTVPPLTEAEKAIDLSALAQAEGKDRARPYTFAGKGLGEVKPAKSKGEAGRKAEYKNLSLDEIQERERERNRRRHDKARGRTATPATAQPEPLSEPKKAAPIGVKRAGLVKSLSNETKAQAIAEIAARAAALPEVKPAKRRTAENAESRREAFREKEKKRRERMLIEFEANPEAREKYLAQRRESDRKRRAREGSRPRPNGRIENNGLDRRPKGEKC